MSTTQATPRFIVIPPEPSTKVQLAAADLAEVIELRSGKKPEIIESRWRFPKNAIFIGDTPVTVSSLRLPRALSTFGSVARRSAENRIFLRARNEKALVHGIYTFAHEQYGARWFLPRENTVFLVERDPKNILPSPRRILMEPSFIARQLTGFDLIDGGDFSRRNRLNLLFDYNHALAHIFTADVFGEQPALFSVRNGLQTRPRGSHATDPQPHFASQAVADFAAQAVLAFFETNPDAQSFSLGPNDNTLFDDSELTRAIVEPISWFRGKPNYTDLIFTFMNRVAERVFDEGGAWYNEQGEPRYLTTLAYYWAEAAPSFPIHPRVMPILTADRAQWHDPDYRAEDKELIRQWGASGADLIGTWDYYMGPPLPYPRQYTRDIIASVRHLAENNTGMFYAAMPYVSALHGAQTYLLTQLLWDPWQDADVLLDDFYQHVFGPAADTMRSFYETFESKRAESEGQGEWIKFYKDEACIELFPIEFLKEMADVLDKAAAEANEDATVLKRIQSIQRDFELTLIYHDFQSARRAVVESFASTSHGTSPDADDIIRALQQFHSTSEQLTDKLQSLFKIPRYYRHFRWLQPDWRHQSKPTKAALGSLLQTSAGRNLLQQHPEVMREHDLSAFLAPKEHAKVDSGSSIQNPLLIHDANARESRYLFPEDMPQVPGWLIDLRPAEFLKVNAAQDTPGMGIRIAGSDATSAITQAWVVGGGHYLLETEFEAQASPDNRTRLEVIWVDADNRVIQSQNVLQVPVSGWDEKTDPARSYTFNLQIPLIAPDNAKLLRVRFSTSRQYPGDFLEIRFTAMR